MGLGNFLQQVGIAAGQTMLAGQAYQQGQVELENRKQDIEVKQQQVAAAKLSAQASRDAANMIQSGMAKDSATVSDPTAKAKLYTETAGRLAATGSFDMAQKMEALAKGELDIAGKMQADILQKGVVAKEALAKTALDYAASPTPEGQKTLVKAAIDAGYDPTKIPAPNTTEFRAWALNQQTAGSTAKDVLAAKEKAREFNEREAERKAEFQAKQAESAARRSETAAFRNESLALRKILIESKTGKSDLTAQEKGTVTAVLGAAGEATRGLEQALKMPVNARMGAFANLHDGTVIDALTKTGTNALTPEQVQLYTSNMGGMALEASRVITLGAGKSANESTIRELQKALVPQQGDTEYTAMYKIATAASIIRNRLEYLPEIPETRGKQRGQLDKLMKALDAVPEPDEILQASLKNPVASRQLNAFKGTMQSAINQTLDKAPAAPAAGTVSVDDWLKSPSSK
jgi:hypothetical protein